MGVGPGVGSGVGAGVGAGDGPGLWIQTNEKRQKVNDVRHISKATVQNVDTFYNSLSALTLGLGWDQELAPVWVLKLEQG